MRVKVCIDPGHGMGNTRPGVFDPGAQGHGYREADLTLKMALTLKFVFVDEGVNYFMTRSNNTTNAPLAKRVERATTAKCTHYLSLHMNSDGPTASGTESYWRDTKDRNLAEVVQPYAVGAFDLNDRGLKWEGESQHTRLFVFNFAGPTTLVEMGFISNYGDALAIDNRNNRLDFATKLAAFFKFLESQ